MKKKALLLSGLLLILVFGLSRLDGRAPAAYPGPAPDQPTEASQGFTPNDNQVCFYENANYGGNYICLNAGREYPDLGAFLVGTSNKNWHDKISSVIIGANACAVLWEHSNEGGYCLTLHGNGTSARYIPNLSSYNFNDKASCIKCNAFSSCPPKEPASNQVVFFEHSNYDGYYMVYTADNDQSNISCYYMGSTPYNWNDKISSMKVGSQACATTWLDANYKGQRNFFEGNGSSVAGYPDLGASGLGDRITSFKIRGRGNCSIE